MLQITLDKKALLALMLLVPASSIGVATQLYFLPGLEGYLVALLSKVWLLLFPVIWLSFVDKNALKIQYPKRSDLLAGVGLGLIMLFVILTVYWLLGWRWIDTEYVRERARLVGFSSFNIYLLGAGYWIFINSLLEEFIWRWFVYRQCEILVSSRLAVILSALFFTIHHIIGLAAYFDWRATALCSCGVFIAGIIWSWCYLNYRSIWIGYISHIFADIAIFLIGWQLIFV
ncbi:CPBP family intramembrane glutamic endopeptidase [Nostoc sp. FACHB-133]|uniref:CPBP family intramembrane glutamic endopeptidase n=1 Tax=Nostoc sp. FACHB-133 TaxID=2692835 RepID=UPI001682043A|nr:type II CAAX endopeptidase family protein [Nostoc sp. FACHB-133]MBD2527615.1 CPBP family intramembrane metalloprotease [Nostoc sp. FACHB-133]